MYFVYNILRVNKETNIVVVVKFCLLVPKNSTSQTTCILNPVALVCIL